MLWSQQEALRYFFFFTISLRSLPCRICDAKTGNGEMNRVPAGVSRFSLRDLASFFLCQIHYLESTKIGGVWYSGPPKNFYPFCEGVLVNAPRLSESKLFEWYCQRWKNKNLFPFQLPLKKIRPHAFFFLLCSLFLTILWEVKLSTVVWGDRASVSTTSPSYGHHRVSKPRSCLLPRKLR